MVSKINLIKKLSLNYKDALDLQIKLRDDLLQSKGENTLFFTSHPHVITLGKSEDGSNLIYPAEFYREKGIDIVKVDRGGKATYHGPGQLIGYMIFNLNDFSMGIKDFIFKLEEILIELLSYYGIKANRNKEFPIGLWNGNKKIAFIGMHVTKGITHHGFSLNVNPDLAYFNYLNSCGIKALDISSILKETNVLPQYDEIVDKLLPIYEKHLDCKINKY